MKRAERTPAQVIRRALARIHSYDALSVWMGLFGATFAVHSDPAGWIFALRDEVRKLERKLLRTQARAARAKELAWRRDMKRKWRVQTYGTDFFNVEEADILAKLRPYAHGELVSGEPWEHVYGEPRFSSFYVRANLRERVRLPGDAP